MIEKLITMSLSYVIIKDLKKDVYSFSQRINTLNAELIGKI